MKLSNLTHDAGHPLTRHRFGGLPASYLFVETVVGSGVLGEAASNRLTQILQAAVGRLQNFMTPGASSDLEAMLGFFAPKGGGLPKVREMVKKAGELKTPIDQDQNWWQELFTVFNVQDPGVHQEIQAKAIQSVGQPQAEQPDPTADPASGAATAGGPAAGGMDPATLDALKQHRQSLGNNNAELMNMLAQNTATREASMARLRELQAQMDALSKPKGPPGAPAPAPVPTEAVFNAIAKQLLSEADVKSNLRFVGSNLMRRLGYVSTTPVQEVNWLKKFAAPFEKSGTVDEGFRDFFRNLRMMAANPGFMQQKNENSQLKSRNQRVAKLAVQHLSDFLTQEMNQRLQVANLTVKDVVAFGVEWNKLRAQYAKFKGGSIPDAFRQRYQAAQDQLQRIVFALDPNLSKGATP